MSFYDKLALLPKDTQEKWEEYLLNWYSLEKASRLLDYLIEADTWLPRIFDVAVSACNELKVIRLPEAEERLRAVDINIDSPFLQAVAEAWGPKFSIGYHYGYDLEITCLWCLRDSERWIRRTKELLASDKLVRVESLLNDLDISVILRHWATFGAFESILEEAGIWSELSPLEKTGYPNLVSDNEELEVRKYYGTRGMDHYYVIYKDPSIRLSDNWDIFYFDETYLKRVFNVIAQEMRSRKITEIGYGKLVYLLIDKWGIQYDKPNQFLKEFVTNLCTISAWGLGENRIDGERAQRSAGLQKQHGGKLGLIKR